MYGALATIVLYRVTNRMHLIPPQLLPFTPVDRAMPFWTWTVWIYFSEYFIFFAAYFSVKSNEIAMRYFYAYMAILVTSAIVFLLYPVTFPRDHFPVLQKGLSDQALLFLRDYLDTPANCLPSLHVSSCFISGFCFWGENKRKAVLFSLWSVLVSISTLTTKQHYLVDIWTALILTLAFHYYCFYKLQLSPGKTRAEGAIR